MTEKVSLKLEDEKVSIIVVHNDKPAYLNLCLQSISVTSLNNNYEVVIIDNNSVAQDAKDLLNGLEDDYIVIRNESNLGWTKAANQGVKATDPQSKYLIFLHHDVVVLNHGWMDWLINVAESQDSGLIGLSMDHYDMDGVSGKKIPISFIEEWCMLVSRKCWDACGPFNEKLEQIGAPFLFTLAAQINDYKPQVVTNHLVHHYGVMAMNVNDLEVHYEKAMSILPSLMREQHNKFFSN